MSSTLLSLLHLTEDRDSDLLRQFPESFQDYMSSHCKMDFIEPEIAVIKKQLSKVPDKESREFLESILPTINLQSRSTKFAVRKFFNICSCEKCRNALRTL